MKLLATAALMMLGACSSLSDLSPLKPYRIDVRQGNFVTQEMVAQLKVGQTREQVRFILGSPLIEDVFHARRWDYVYRFAKGGMVATERRLTLHFEDEKLARLEGDVVSAVKAGAPDEAVKPRVIEIFAPTNSTKP
jgi:outer membrane protein assembly factor BamE